MRRRRGFTLLEALLSVALFLMVMALTGSILNAAWKAEKHFGEQDRTQELALSVLYRLAFEVRSASSFTTVGPNAIEFLSPDWQLQSNEFPTPPTPFPSTWNPTSPAFQMRIRYALNGTELERTLWAESQRWDSRLMSDCRGFLVERLQPTLFRFTISFLSKGQDKSFSLQAAMPVTAWEQH